MKGSNSSRKFFFFTIICGVARGDSEIKEGVCIECLVYVVGIIERKSLSGLAGGMKHPDIGDSPDFSES